MAKHKPNLIDIVDENNQPLGFSLSIDEANLAGHYHRSVHAVIRTAEGKYLAEKRSGKIFIEPNLLDLTMGGYVDAGESVAQALIREIEEELGLKVHERQATELFMHKESRYHPRFKRLVRGFTYCYLVQLSPEQTDYKIQESEVSKLLILPHKQTRRLIRRYSLPGFGKLMYAHKFYKELLDKSEQLS